MYSKLSGQSWSLDGFQRLDLYVKDRYCFASVDDLLGGKCDKLDGSTLWSAAVAFVSLPYLLFVFLFSEIHPLRSLRFTRKQQQQQQQLLAFSCIFQTVQSGPHSWWQPSVFSIFFSRISDTQDELWGGFTRIVCFGWCDCMFSWPSRCTVLEHS